MNTRRDPTFNLNSIKKFDFKEEKWYGRSLTPIRGEIPKTKSEVSINPLFHLTKKRSKRVLSESKEAKDLKMATPASSRKLLV